MSILDIKDLSFKYRDKPLFEGAEMRLFEGEHLALVGPNGSGKTTFIKLIIKALMPDKGTILWAPSLKLGYLDQYLSLDEHMTVKHYLLEVYEDLFKEELRMLELYEGISNGTSVDVDLDLIRATHIQDRLLESDFYRIKSNLGSIVNGLGMDSNILDQKIGILSGGMREKLILGKLLLQDSDVLILDEPTNFLDDIHVEWLAKFLKSYDKTFIVVSHDETFLHEIATTVVAIENKKLVRYKGNYTFYLENRTLREEQLEKAYISQQRDIQAKKEFVEKNIVRKSTTKRAQSVRRKLLKMEIIEKPVKPKNISMWFPFSNPTGKEVLKIHDLVIGYNDKPLLKPINLTIYNGQKVIITGYNGIGKSTFVKTILREIDSIEGDFLWIDTARINYFSQDLDLEENLSAFEHLYYEMNVDNQTEVYTLLAQYGITYEQARRPLKTLSGGQQTKVRLALMHAYDSNVLILDEPTTHLDVQAKKALKKAIDTYQGTIILITHETDFFSDLDVMLVDFETI